MNRPLLEKALEALEKSNNALLDYVDRLEKQGGSMYYGRSVIRGNNESIAALRAALEQESVEGYAIKGQEDLARAFHALYEELAPQFGYATRVETRTFDPQSPNGRLMIEVCKRLLTCVAVTITERKEHP